MSDNTNSNVKIRMTVDPKNAAHLHYLASSQPLTVAAEERVYDFYVVIVTQRTVADSPRSVRIWSRLGDCTPDLLHRYWPMARSKAYGRSMYQWAFQNAGLVLAPKQQELTIEQLADLKLYRKMKQTYTPRLEEKDGKYRKLHGWKQPVLGWSVDLATPWVSSVLAAESELWKQFHNLFPSHPIYLNRQDDDVKEQINMGSIEDITLD